MGDDIIDLFGREEVTGKRVGQDIAEHKLGNVLVVLALEELEGDERDRLVSILRNPRVTPEMVSEAIGIISGTRARRRAEALRDEYADRAVGALGTLPDSEAKEALVELAEFIKRREY